LGGGELFEIPSTRFPGKVGLHREIRLRYRKNDDLMTKFCISHVSVETISVIGVTHIRARNSYKLNGQCALLLLSITQY